MQPSQGYRTAFSLMLRLREPISEALYDAMSDSLMDIWDCLDEEEKAELNDLSGAINLIQGELFEHEPDSTEVGELDIYQAFLREDFGEVMPLIHESVSLSFSRRVWYTMKLWKLLLPEDLYADLQAHVNYEAE